MRIPARVNFCHTFQTWDGFGVNYVETSQTVDFVKHPQDYGGFSKLTEAQRQEILDLIFGDNGLRPGVFKMFIDCFQQDEKHVNGPEISDVNQSNYDHETTTRWMRYFIRNGVEMTRRRGDSMQGIATLYGPPAFMTKIRQIRGRDLDPNYEIELAKYIVAFGKFMKEHEGIPLRYLSIHNEGEDFYRWPEDGLSPNIGTGHDYNMYWPPEQVVSFLPLLRQVADATQSGLLPTPGECTGWTRFTHWGYANALAESPEALSALGLITSHGFFGDGLCERWSNNHAGTGVEMLRRERPELHAWVTSTSWKKMNARFAYELHRAVYDTGVNAIIPWAAVQCHEGWVGGDPNPGCAILVNSDGSYSIEKGYYYYKQYCRYAQPGMTVAAGSCANTNMGITVFSGTGTKHPNAIMVANTHVEPIALDMQILNGGQHWQAIRTSPTENCEELGVLAVNNGMLQLECPPDSVTTLVEQA